MGTPVEEIVRLADSGQLGILSSLFVMSSPLWKEASHHKRTRLEQQLKEIGKLKTAEVQEQYGMNRATALRAKRKEINELTEMTSDVSSQHLAMLHKVKVAMASRYKKVVVPRLQMLDVQGKDIRELEQNK